MRCRVPTLGVLAGVLLAATGLPSRALAETGSGSDQTSQLADALARFAGDAQWEWALVARYIEDDVLAEPAVPSFRSGSEGPATAEAPGTADGPGPSLSIVRSLALWEAVEAPAPAPAGRGDGGWLDAIAPVDRDLSLFLAAQSTLLLDMAQTLEIARSPSLEETNPLLGERPSDGAVLAYFGSVATAHAATYLLLDGRWANLVSRAILFVQVPAIDHNTRLGVRISF